jgi:hypothetical protein
MEDHFDRIFATDSGSGNDSLEKKRQREGTREGGSGRGKAEDYQQFIRANKFQGKKFGYIFQMGPHGLGYYFDQYQLSLSSSLSEKEQKADMVKKRKLDHLSPATSSSSSAMSVEKILEESEQNDIEILNPVTLTKVFPLPPSILPLPLC